MDVRKFLLLLSCFTASPLAAGETMLSGEAIKTTLGGSLLALDTPIGTTVSVRINHDGLMSGEAGALGPVLGAPTDHGRWWVEDSKVCFKWFRWFDAEARCATISLEGNRFTWRRDDGDTGTGTIVELGKPLPKSQIIVAQSAPSGPPQTQAAKKSDVAVALNAPKVERKPDVVDAEAPAPSQRAKPAVAAVRAAPTPERQPAPPVIASNVPEPRLAVRPRHSAKIAIASVKPQFFAHAASLATKDERPVQKPFRVAGVDPSDVLNIRNGPSADYDTVGGIPPDSHGIAITGPCQNDWCPVKHRLLVGWVNRRYLAEDRTADTSAADIPNYWDANP